MISGTDTRLSLGLAVLLAFLLRPGASLAFDHSSARISALGWDHVSGVIPDLYTDITVNPAYAFFAERPVVCYAKRYVPAYAPSLPYLERDSGNYFYRSSMSVNELSAWGIRLSSWRTAVFAQWALNRPENSYSEPSIGIGTRYTLGLSERGNSSDNDFGRIDLIAARALGDRYTLGLRLQGWGYYNASSDMRAWATEYYYDPSFSQIDHRNVDTNAQSFSGRRLSFDLQAGIVKSNDAGPRTDLALKVSLNRLNHQRQIYDLHVYKQYDSEGLINGYNYSRFRWSDDRKGDLWTYELTLRHAFDGGVRVLAGGGASTCSYETRWSSSQDFIEWSSGRNEAIVGAFDGDGSLLGGSCFIKGGKIFSLHETTDLYLGLHGILARTRTKEKPLVHYIAEPDGEESIVRIDQPVRLESTETSFELYLPLSIEFRPSGYFTFFSSFILFGTWDKQTTTKPMPSLFYYNPPGAESLAGGANRAAASSQAVIEPEAYLADWERSLSTGNTVTVGFSLHYRDRFFIDVYSGTEIIPSYLDERVLDIRYVF